MDELLRVLVDTRDRVVQKSRIAFGNRISAIERGVDIADEKTLATYKGWYDRFVYLEDELDHQIADLVKDMEIIRHMSQIRGLGLILSARIISMIDIERADTVSALWRYAGLGVIDGQRERLIKGEKAHYNRRLKTTLYVAGLYFLRYDSPYARIYETAKEYYTANRPGWTKGHCHNAAMRKMMKVFLAHLWRRWRQLEGLPVPDLYAMSKLGHNHYMAPEEFGWPELELRPVRIMSHYLRDARSLRASQSAGDAHLYRASHRP